MALANTLDLAERADAWGYHRYWVSEHHNDPAFAHASPEILVGALASRTKRIRVGAGGVLLTHYSPFKVAEQFNLLEALYPGRVDLGVGRAGGGEGLSDNALRPWGADSASHWDKVQHLLAYLGMGRESAKPFAGVDAMPLPANAPPLWVLGTSPASAQFAGEHGLPYAFGGFIDPRQLMACLSTYHQRFQPSRWLERPQAQVTWVVLAADTEAQAKELGRSAEVWFVRTFARGQTSRFPTVAEAFDERLSPQEEALALFRRQHALAGTADQVLDGLAKMQRQLALDELGLVTLTADHADRVRSYELLAKG